MSDHRDLRTSHRMQLPRPASSVVTIPWHSDAARAAVARTCQAVEQRCRRVITRYYISEGVLSDSGLSGTASADQDELEHITIGDPDPTSPANMIAGYQACRFEWTDETTLHWACTRRVGHPGLHLAGTGRWVVAVHPADCTDPGL